MDDLKKNANYFPRVEADKFLSSLSIGNTILDVGCGSGRDTRIFTELGYKVTGIDISEKLLDMARKENPGLDFQYMDTKTLSFQDGTFDGIWANAIIHHLSEQEMKIAIQEWGRVCRQAGVLYIATKMAPLEITNPDEKKTFTFISPEKLKMMCEASGFEQIDIYTYNEKQRNSQGRDLMWIAAFFRKASF